ncbi:MAG: hypothetical protein Q4G08_11900 [Capnocytophaga sp.]|nr:hypothetical protein [Capnocytophaga sp.]
MPKAENYSSRKIKAFVDYNPADTKTGWSTGGVILNDRYVLTAVYCINPNLPKDYLVRV